MSHSKEKKTDYSWCWRISISASKFQLTVENRKNIAF